MTESWDYVPSCAAEFPNDNPALHDGASWVCLRVSGPPRPVTRPRSPSVERSGSTRIENTRAIAAVPTVASTLVAESAAVPFLPSSAEPVVQPVAEWNAAEDRLPESVLSALLQTLDVEHAPSESTETPTLAVVESALELDAPPSVASKFSGTVEDSSAVPAVLELDAPGDSEIAPSAEMFAFDADGETTASESHQQTLEPDRLPANGAALEARATVANSEPAAPDAFAALVAALVDVALSAGATRAAAVLPELLERGTLDVGAFSDDIRAGLIAARLASASSGPTENFLSAASAWRRVLRGESADLSACGPSTLDEWATAVLKGFGIGQGGKTDVRRELRRRGVAAFGMLLAA